ncbi:hypothetical protein MRX96_006551 [Rhipicephalus microplus]
MRASGQTRRVNPWRYPNSSVEASRAPCNVPEVLPLRKKGERSNVVLRAPPTAQVGTLGALGVLPRAKDHEFGNSCLVAPKPAKGPAPKEGATGKKVNAPEALHAASSPRRLSGQRRLGWKPESAFAPKPSAHKGTRARAFRNHRGGASPPTSPVAAAAATTCDVPAAHPRAALLTSALGDPPSG